MVEGEGGAGAPGRGAEPPGLGLTWQLLARNVGLNLLGLGLPLVVAVATVPPLVRGLGAERFGVLALTWMVLGFLGELGVGRAATKFVAEALAAGDPVRASAAAWVATVVQAVFGVVCAAALAAGTPWLVGGVLNVPPGLAGEVRLAFRVLAAAIPPAVVASSVRGTLEAVHRFDLVTAVRLPGTIANYVFPLAALGLGWSLPGVVASIAVARLGVLGALVVLVARAVPAVRVRPPLDGAPVRELVTYGGWIGVSSVVSPVLVYVDRLMLGMLVTLSAVAYYAAPYEVVNRLVILPASVVATLFPAFSALGGRAEWERVQRLSVFALKAILLAMGFVVVVLIAGAADLLRVWLGADFARESAAAFVILTAGVLANGLAHVPFALVQGLGRADLTAKFHLLELPVHLVLVWVLVRAWGIPGAALAWSLRAALDAILLFLAARRLAGLSARVLVRGGVAEAGALVVAAGVLALVIPRLTPDIAVRAVAVVAMLAAFGWAAWRRALDGEDRARLLAVLRRAWVG